jgi:hypothetical protein
MFSQVLLESALLGRRLGLPKAEEVRPARAAWERFSEIKGGRTRLRPERQVKSLPPELCH